jgi:hypothetical protein
MIRTTERVHTSPNELSWLEHGDSLRDGMLHTILLQIKVVKQQLGKQQEEKKYSEEKMAAYVETKAKGLHREKPP